MNVAALIAATVLALLAVLLRYELIPIPIAAEGHAAVYRLDRWTGDVRYLSGDKWLTVKPLRPNE